MEEFSRLGGGNATTPTRGYFTYASSSSSPTAPAAAVAPGVSVYGRSSSTATFSSMQHHQQPTTTTSTSNHHHLISQAPIPPPTVKLEGGSSQQQQQLQFLYPFGRRGGSSTSGSSLPTDVDAIKAKIISHPQYSTLLEAYMDCQKVGAPPEVVARLAAVGREFEARQRTAVSCHGPSTDPELDQFMEAYCDMLVKYREELTRPLQEAMDFFRRMESQLNVLTNGSASVFSPDDKSEGVGSSEEDQDAGGEETEHPEIDPRAEDQELKHHLLKKYSGYLSSLKQELSKKRKKGKLPKEARQKLLNWWELHYKWPYPSETEKVALAESTGLDQKQINNWFINQRKRHWKPSEDMQFVVMDGFHPHSASALYMDGPYLGDDGGFRLGP